MNRSLTYLICTIFALLFAINAALAHSGGTDFHGGHFVHRTGEYHFHHGRHAHQHHNGKCPLPPSYNRAHYRQYNHFNYFYFAEELFMFLLKIFAVGGIAFWLFSLRR